LDGKNRENGQKSAQILPLEANAGLNGAMKSQNDWLHLLKPFPV
jgi:hypothetical protein